LRLTKSNKKQKSGKDQYECKGEEGEEEVKKQDEEGKRK
jgi:hypothetical protein